MWKSTVFACALLLAGVAAAASPQPTEEMLADAKERFAWLITVSGITQDRIVANLAAYFGQDFEAAPDRGRVGQTDIYLVRRDPGTGQVTYRAIVGSIAVDQ